MMCSSNLPITVAAAWFAAALLWVPVRLSAADPPADQGVPCPPSEPFTYCTLTGHTDWVRTLAFSPDGQSIASGGTDNALKVWSLAAGKQVLDLPGHTGFVNAVAFSPRGDLLVSGSYDNSVRLWDPRSGEPVGNLEGHTDHVETLAFSPDGTRLASGGWDKTLRLWDPATRRELRILQQDTGTIVSVAFSPDGTLVASCAGEGLVKLWNAGTGQAVATLSLRRSGDAFAGYEVAFSPDGRHLGAASGDHAVRLWGLPPGEELQRFTDPAMGAYSVAFSPDGRIIATDACGKRDPREHCIQGDVVLWDLASGRPVRTLADPRATSINALAFSPDGRYLATAAGNDIRVWNLGGLAGAAAGSATPAGSSPPIPAAPETAPAVPPKLLEGLKSPDPQVRFNAVKTLGRQGPQARAAWPVLKEMARQDGDEKVRRAAVAALVAGYMDDLKAADERQRRQAVNGLVALGSQARAALPQLNEVAGHDPSTELRQLAARVVARLTQAATTGQTAPTPAVPTPSTPLSEVTVPKTAESAALAQDTLKRVIAQYPLVWGREIGAFKARYTVTVDGVPAGTLDASSSLPGRGLALEVRGAPDGAVTADLKRIGERMLSGLVSIQLALLPDKPLHAVRSGDWTYLDASDATPVTGAASVLVTVAADLHELRSLVRYRDGTSAEAILGLRPIDGGFELTNLVTALAADGQVRRGESYSYSNSRRFGPVFPETVTVQDYVVRGPIWVFTLAEAAFDRAGSLRSRQEAAEEAEREADAANQDLNEMILDALRRKIEQRPDR